MKIRSIIWSRNVIEKLDFKHQVQTWEVEEVLENHPKFYFLEKGRVAGEDLYQAVGQTDEGRYLNVYFIHKSGGDALIVTARDMNDRERKRYGKKG